MEPGLLLVGGAVGLGAFTIGRRTIDTMGDDLTEMPLLAALVVAVVSSTLVTVLSWFDIPVSVVIIATMSIVGLGWGRATRTATVAEAVEDPPDVSVDALAGDDVPTVGEGGTPAAWESPAIGEEDVPAAADLFEPTTTAKVIALQNLVPAVSTLAAYLVFRFLPVF
jgi:PiT family inorganic phosphate transporter